MLSPNATWSVHQACLGNMTQAQRLLGTDVEKISEFRKQKCCVMLTTLPITALSFS